MKLWNIEKFVGFNIKELAGRPQRPQKLQPADRWILSEYSAVVENATKLMDAYQFDKAMREVEVFLWHEFADHYIEMVKHRRDESSRFALYTIGLGLARMLAPFMPHVTEEIHDRHFRDFEGEGSIHNSRWPEPVLRDESAEMSGALARDVVAALRAWKGSKGLRLGQPVGTVYIFGKGGEQLKDYIDDIRGTLKAEKVLLARPPALKEEVVGVQPVKPKIGPVFKARAGLVAAAIEKLVPSEAGEALAKGPVEVTLPDGAKVQVTPDMVRLERATLAGKARVEALAVGELTILAELPKR
jgi:valyl-tRNA synthetase